MLGYALLLAVHETNRLLVLSTGQVPLQGGGYKQGRANLAAACMRAQQQHCPHAARHQGPLTTPALLVRCVCPL